MKCSTVLTTPVMSVSTCFILLGIVFVMCLSVYQSMHMIVFTAEFILPIVLPGFYPWHTSTPTLQVWVNLMLCSVSVWLMVWFPLSELECVSRVLLLQWFIMCSFLPTTFRCPLEVKWVAVLLLQSTLMSGLGERKDHESRRDLHMLHDMEWSLHSLWPSFFETVLKC